MKDLTTATKVYRLADGMLVCDRHLAELPIDPVMPCPTCHQPVGPTIAQRAPARSS